MENLNVNVLSYLLHDINLSTPYLILEAKKAIILEGIENTQTRAVYKNAKVAMAGKAKV